MTMNGNFFYALYRFTTMIESIERLIQSDTFPPVLLMFGQEEFLLEEAFQQIVQHCSQNGLIQGFNFDVKDGSEVSLETLVEMARAFPMMSERRVILVKHLEKINVGRGNNAEKKSPLTPYLVNPSLSTVLVLVADNEDLYGLKNMSSNPKQQEKALKKRKALKFPYNLLIERCEWIEFPKLYDRELPSWVFDRIKKLGKEISPDACELLITQSGESLRDLHNEIQKIFTYLPDKKKYTKDDIIGLLGASKTYNIFELQKAVGEKKLSNAMVIVRNMLIVDRQELMIVTMVFRYFTILWKLSESVGKTQHHAELGKIADISPFFIPEYLAALQRYNQEQIQSAFFALRDADIAIKSSENPETTLQKMLLRIMS